MILFKALQREGRFIIKSKVSNQIIEENIGHLAAKSGILAVASFIVRL